MIEEALLSWIAARGIGTALIEPGKPWQNDVTESFNGKFRDECLSLEWFRTRAEAKVISRIGVNTTTPCGRIRALAISHRTNLQVGKQKTQPPAHIGHMRQMGAVSS
jgi:transposase InsO family protein